MTSLQPPPTTSKVPPSAIKKAVTALLNHKSKTTTTTKPQLLPSDEFLYLVITLIKIPPKPRVNAFKIPLTHPLYSPSINTELCLFVHDSNSAPVKAYIKENNIPISKVIKLSKLKTDYKSYEQKRKLCDSYDLFLADKRVVPLLPNCIGKCFYKKKKIPVPVELGRAQWEAQVERIVGSGLLYLGTGSCTVMRVARASMTEEQIMENVVAAVEGVAGVVPKKWGNVRSFHLKFAESLALPVYQKVPEMGYKIESGVAAGGEEGEKVKRVKRAKNVVGEKSAEKKKKGRIHEVRYMDEEVGMVGGDEDGSGSESEGEEAIVDEEVVVVGKKRKSGDAVKKGLKLKKGESESEEDEEAFVDEKVVGKKRKEGVKSLKSKKVVSVSASGKKVKKSKVAV